MNSARPDRPELRLDWCSHKAARYAVEHWHYSRSMPTPPVVALGVWEAGRYIGAVLFSRGANNNLGKPYGLSNTEVCELTRVALAEHTASVSRVVSVALKFLGKRSPGLRLCVSFADPNKGHHGGIYQAGNWVYVGQSPPGHKYVDTRGREWHQRQVSVTGVKPQYGTLRRVPKIRDCVKVPELGKHRYLYPLDPAMRVQLAPLAKPYPKRASEPTGVGAGDQPEKGGSIPTRTLQEAGPHA